MSREPPQQYGTQGQGYEQADYGQGGRSGGHREYGQQGGQAGQSGQRGQYGEPGGQQAQYGQEVGQQWGQQTGRQREQQGGRGEQFQGGAATDLKLEEAISDEMRVALHDFVQSATACEWCAERCIDHGPEMSECLRLCRDVADLATLNVQLVARDSVFGPEAAEVFANAAEACAEECARHRHRHCQECAEVLTRAVRSTRKMLASFGTGGGMEPRAGAGAPGMGAPGQEPGGMEYGGQTTPAQSGGMGAYQGQTQF